MAQKQTPNLSAEAIQSAIRQSLGNELNISPCYRSCEGCDHSVWIVGSDIVLRGLPATGRENGWSEASLKRDAAVCAMLRRRMSRQHLVPEVHQTILIDKWICNLETQIHGNSVEDVRPTTRNEDDLAYLLRALASVPVDEGKAVTTYEEDRPNLKKRVSKALQAWDDLNQAGYVPTHAQCMHKFLRDRLKEVKALDDSKYHPVFLHGDLKGEHIFIEPTTGELKGVIDWSDALVGDPCRDIADMSKAVGQDMARRIGIKAQHSVSTVERGILYSMCLAILSLEDRILGDDDSPEGLLRTQFRRAFEGTAFADLLA